MAKLRVEKELPTSLWENLVKVLARCEEILESSSYIIYCLTFALLYFETTSCSGISTEEKQF